MGNKKAQGDYSARKAIPTGEDFPFSTWRGYSSIHFRNRVASRRGVAIPAIPSAYASFIFKGSNL